MTGLVFTDERGHEQGVLGKLVYTTDESGSSNMILQVDTPWKNKTKGGVHDC